MKKILRFITTFLIIATVAVAAEPGGAEFPYLQLSWTKRGQRSASLQISHNSDPVSEVLTGERLDLWSLKAPVSSKKSVDELVLAALAKEKSQFATEADPRTLIRRLTFDLLGLPPTPEEVASFQRDSSGDRSTAYRKLVDRLLASPRYGERQARLWLDVVRYADTNGYERDEFRPLIYQYRDYVIRSFNQDKPFDQFIREQLAGDELLICKTKGEAIQTKDEDLLLATGFLRLGQWDSTASIFQEEARLRAEMMADLTNTTASAFLGMTFSCCQCHDHKYDPLTQADHYRLRAFFSAIQDKNDTVISTADELAEIKRHNDALEAQAEPLRKEQAAKKDDNKIAQQIDEMMSRKREPRKAMTAQDSGPKAPATHILYQGDYASPRDAVEPGFPSVFTPAAAVISAPSESTTGRRLALANWVASAKNPWTARVIVNRIWQQHFGTGIVATPNDFGFSGVRPTNQELLDTLAVEFMERGWSIKELHRLIVMSATYRQQSGGSVEAGASAGTGLQVAVRPTVRRLDAETLRDALLSVSGLLKPYDSGKPLWPPVEAELLQAQPSILEAEKGGDGGRLQGWYANALEETDVRSIFLVRKRCLPIPFLQAFDLPDSTVSCARRDTTVVAPQALMLLNSEEAIRYAKVLADRLTANRPLDFDHVERTEKLIVSLFQYSLVRDPTDEQRSLSIEFLRRQVTEHAKNLSADQAAHRALVDLCRAILNLNEFTYVD